MVLTYLLTVVIVTAWLLKILAQRSFKFVRTPLDWPILIFLLANLISTVLSIDPHTSLYGYYSRFNGGFFSILSYSLLYFALTNNFDKAKAKVLILVGLVSGALVAVYGILQHPNPLFAKHVGNKWINHGIDYTYWAEAVERRVFSTLGQPNWLAAYLAMLLPLSLTLMLLLKKTWQKAPFLLLSLTFYLTITYTLSRGGTLGLIATGLIFSLFLTLYRQSLTNRIKRFFGLRLTLAPVWEKNYLWLAAFLVAVLLLNSNLGNALSLRGVNPSTEARGEEKSSQSQLEIDGAQTGRIRLVVWQGAFDIFRHYPLFGTGVETFGYSYYLFRPAEHNQTAEWDYLYNKAHNEYLNYLANTGIVGLASYLLLIGIFVFWAIRYLLQSKMAEERLWVLALFSAFVGFLVQNIFGFSVVIIALFFFLFPALAFLISDQTRSTDYFEKFVSKHLKNPLSRQLLTLVAVFLGLYSLFFVGKIWLADTFYAQGVTVDETVNYKNLRQAVSLFPGEPLYRSELALGEASLAAEVDDEKLKNDLIAEAHDLNQDLVREHPHHTTLARNSLQTLYSLAQLDKKYWPETLQAAEKLGQMAPTDASIQYNLAVIYRAAGDKEKALKQIEKVLKLKPDYDDAKDLQKSLITG